ncbi:Predicted arabinose efflux permease, MFS family [Microlunatus sagamiharensis]|uniref:Predicted arabinose efflux permease, MFS family n=1 Tax=Microlunatus sagamiharensis TaxID=546874 RepID=A0A1H2NIY5_9ACTN|nr:MFS transporter [Microlunatus sagamiharensis]SDV04776.1 Predicted arabinose efflux permease, MFS family [Microlunatus sagamiharensis]
MTTPDAQLLRGRRRPGGLGGRFRRIGSRWSWTAMLWLWLLYGMNANMRSWIQTVQPAIVEEFGVGPTTIGWFSGGLTILLGVAALPISAWSDKGGHGWERKFRHLPVVAVYLAFSVLTGVHALTVGLLAVFLLQAVKNLASGGGEAIEVTAVAEWWPLERRGFAQGLHHTAFPWGTLIGGLGVAGVYSLFGSENWRVVWLTLPLLAIPIFALYWRFATQENYDRFVADTRARGLTPPLGQQSADVPAAPGAVGRALRNPNVVIPSLSAGLANVGYMGLSFWLPLYLAFVADYPLAQVAALSVVFTITGGVGQIVWGFVSDRFGRKYTLVFLFLWLAVSFSLFRFVGSGLAALIVIQLITGVAINGVYPVLYAITSDSSEPGSIAIGNGLNMAGMLVGGFGAIVMGQLIQLGGGYQEVRGFNLGLNFIAGVSLLTAVLILLFTRETIGRMYAHDRALVSRERCLRGVRR